MLTKQQLRQQARRQRSQLPINARRDGATRAARHATRLLRKARRIGLYLSCASELGTAPLLQQLLKAGKQIYAPKIQGGAMRFVPLRKATVLRRNHHGIPEPVSSCSRSARRLDLILLPLLAFDATGNRLGSGGGYYDRALGFARTFRRPLRVGYAYAIQQLPLLPHDPWDVRLDAVVTDKGVQRWRTG